MTRRPYAEQKQASDRALDALDEMRADFGGYAGCAAELLGRLSWIAPEAVLKAVESERAYRSKAAAS